MFLCKCSFRKSILLINSAKTSQDVCAAYCIDMTAMEWNKADIWRATSTLVSYPEMLGRKRIRLLCPIFHWFSCYALLVLMNKIRT